MDGVDPTKRMVREYRESWIDKLRCKKVKLQRFIETARRIMDNANFERDQKKFLKKVEGGTKHVRQILEMEKSFKFWGDIRGIDDRTLEMPWRESVSQQLRDKITSVKEFNMTVETLQK